MSFEIIDNTFQVIVLAAMALLAFLLAFRRSSRSCLILAFGYASFMMGTLYGTSGGDRNFVQAGGGSGAAVLFRV